jgi:hypothetical protein
MCAAADATAVFLSDSGGNAAAAAQPGARNERSVTEIF